MPNSVEHAVGMQRKHIAHCHDPLQCRFKAQAHAQYLLSIHDQAISKTKSYRFEKGGLFQTD